MAEEKSPPVDAATPQGSVLADADARSARAAEWGQYVAKAPIFHDGVRAYNEGDPVPADNVKRYGYLTQGLVEKRK